MKTLPDTPNLQFLLREAKVLKSSHRGGDLSVCAAIGHFDYSLHGLSNQEVLDTRISILDAQRVVARQYGFSSWSRLKKYVERCQVGKNPSDVKLRNKIFSRYKEIISLQKELGSLHEIRTTQKGDERVQKEYKIKHQQYRQLSQDSTIFMSNAFDRHGWPGPDVIGPDCIEALALVSGNAVYHADFQYRSTQLMGDSLAHGGFNAYWYSQMMDRDLVLSKKPTIYGTSFGYYFDDNGNFNLLEADVVDLENLDKRRARAGHQPIEVMRRKIAKDAKEENWEHRTREQSVRLQEQLSISGGYLRQ